MPRKAAPFLLLSFLGFLASCDPVVIVANMYAQIAPADDVRGDQTTQAYVNFTEFDGSFASGVLRMTFDAPDPEGNNQMTLTLEATSDGGVNAGTYTIDGTNQNAFQTTVVVRREGTVGQQSAVAETGVITVSSVNVASGVLQGISGDFHVNFQAGGGTAEGWFNVTQP